MVLAKDRAFPSHDAFCTVLKTNDEWYTGQHRADRVHRNSCSWPALSPRLVGSIAGGVSIARYPGLNRVPVEWPNFAPGHLNVGCGARNARKGMHEGNGITELLRCPPPTLLFSGVRLYSATQPRTKIPVEYSCTLGVEGSSWRLHTNSGTPYEAPGTIHMGTKVLARGDCQPRGKSLNFHLCVAIVQR